MVPHSGSQNNRLRAFTTPQPSQACGSPGSGESHLGKQLLHLWILFPGRKLIGQPHLQAFPSGPLLACVCHSVQSCRSSRAQGKGGSHSLTGQVGGARAPNSVKTCHHQSQHVKGCRDQGQLMRSTATALLWDHWVCLSRV